MPQSFMMMDPETLRAAMRFWASGVTVVASHADRFETPRGMTVSSFTSVSLEPPLILVCLFKELETVQAILESRVFGVSMLGVDQEHISNRFAAADPAYLDEASRFEGLEIITLETGAPLLKGAPTHLDCRLWQTYEGGTHLIVVGEVVAAHVEDLDSNLEPLVYANRGYRRLKPQNEDP